MSASSTRDRCPISVLIATKNEADNLDRCLRAIDAWADEVIVVDSQSTDGTQEVAQSFGARVTQFRYRGGWPKKRQWALDTQDWGNEWILVLDADEILTEPVKREIEDAISRADCDGFWLRFRIVFLGRQLRFGDTELWKLSLFRRDRGQYEKRLEAQDASMADMEIHEHIVVTGHTEKLTNAIRHENVNSIDRYIAKHNEYSRWEAHVLLYGSTSELPPSLTGTQAQRRRWLKRFLLPLPGSGLLRFLYVYLIRGGFFDGYQGFAYAAFKMVQVFHIKIKMYEERSRAPRHSHDLLSPKENAA